MPAHRLDLTATISSIFDPNNPDGEELGELIDSKFQAKLKQRRKAAASKPRETEENAATGSYQQRSSDTRPLYERLFSLTDAEAGEPRALDRPLLPVNVRLLPPAVVAAQLQTPANCIPMPALNHGLRLADDTPVPELYIPRLSVIPTTAEVAPQQQPGAPENPANHRPPLADDTPVPVAKKRCLRTTIAEDTTPRASAALRQKHFEVSQPVSDPIYVSVEEPQILSRLSHAPEPASAFVIPLAERIKTNRRNVAASARFSPELEPKVKKKPGRRKAKKQTESCLADKEWDVETILSVRFIHDPHISHIRPLDPGPKQFLVRWIGYPLPKDYTWEPEEHLTGAPERLKDFWQRRWAAEQKWAMLGMVTLAAIKFKRGQCGANTA
ncbi:hypothetical protein HDU87_006517 [Geranomyces variabilis]|uniref:Chromo domain-containing protein n=1 Tax=Geranomyces variabilis TaxID=109894 RepID=A0AAD5TF49_9FUNG|nr:hypothetical protein HDU87_006517 [Geranomyces variabilis]